MGYTARSLMMAFIGDHCVSDGETPNSSRFIASEDKPPKLSLGQSAGHNGDSNTPEERVRFPPWTPCACPCGSRHEPSKLVVSVRVRAGVPLHLPAGGSCLDPPKVEETVRFRPGRPSPCQWIWWRHYECCLRVFDSPQGGREDGATAAHEAHNLGIGGFNSHPRYRGDPWKGRAFHKRSDAGFEPLHRDSCPCTLGVGEPYKLVWSVRSRTEVLQPRVGWSPKETL